MGIIELILVAVGLSMDAFAVSICKGLKMKRMNHKQALVIALFFGGFQAMMPLLGWLLGSSFEHYITEIDHWIAFILLNFVGIKMLIDVWKNKNTCAVVVDDKEKPLDLKLLFLLAIATSIDALAVGVTFALLPNINIISSVCLIGIITFGFSFLGVKIGKRFGCSLKIKAAIAGGLILCLMGVKILVEHLGLFNIGY